MPDKVVPIPVRKIYPDEVRGKEVWDQVIPPDEMVWAVCPYLRMHQEESRCHHCPEFEEDEHYGPVQRGCYSFAAEACRVVFAMQRRAK